MADVHTLDVARLEDWLRRFQKHASEQRGYLTELDSAIGDADHGINMDRGMAAVVATLDATPPTSAEELFKRSGMTMISTVGGASGPLYGTFFLRMATAAAAVGELDADAFGRVLHAGLDGIVARGKAEAGDKTLFDALQPALAAYDAAVASGSGLAAAGHAAALAAAAGRDATAPLVARKGRASYLGDRSAGHLDPGATSTALLLQSLDEALAGQ